MSLTTVLLVVFLLKTPFIQSQSTCGDSKIKETEGELTLSDKFETLKITFSKSQECDFAVKGFQNLDFTMIVSNFALLPGADCNNDYVKASDTRQGIAQPKLSVCVANAPKNSTESSNHMLYVKIKATEDPEKKAERSVTLNFNSIQGKQCEPVMISLNGASLQQTYPPSNQKLVRSDCDISVTGYGGRDFTMTTTAIQFNDDCKSNYVVAAEDRSQLMSASYKQCGTSPTANEIKSKSSKLFVKIVTGDGTVTDPKVTFLFKTIFPECGPSEITLTNETQQLTLPADKDFPANSECTIKVSGFQGKNFGMTINSITFPPKCEDGSVTAATKMEALPNKNYTHCGSAPVTDPIQSENGVLYLQIKLGNINGLKPKVTFEFKSGADSSTLNIFVALICYILISINLY